MKHRVIERRRRLRKGQTDAERKLWSILRNRQIAKAKFRRQHSIGGYILDFYSPEYRLGIEADGGEHYEEKGAQQDRLRTSLLPNRHCEGAKRPKQSHRDISSSEIASSLLSVAPRNDEQLHLGNKLRTKELSRLGIKILRFSNSDILNNIEGVYDIIVKNIEGE